MQQMLSEYDITSNWRRTPQYLWRTIWMQDCCKSRSVDDSRWMSIHGWEAQQAGFHCSNYGLPKVHKSYIFSCGPLCPLCPSLHELFKFLAQLLAPLVGLTSSQSRNSKAFVEFMRSQIVVKVETLVLFVVVSLFSSVPTDLAIWVTRHRLESDTFLSERAGFTVDGIMGLLPLCLDATFLSFSWKVYCQAQGIAMGFPVSVVVVNLVMEEIEERVLSNFHSPIYIDPSYLPVHRPYMQYSICYLMPCAILIM